MACFSLFPQVSAKLEAKTASMKLKKKLKKTKKRHFYVAGNDYVGVLVPFSLDGIVNNARGLPL